MKWKRSCNWSRRESAREKKEWSFGEEEEEEAEKRRTEEKGPLTDSEPPSICGTSGHVF